MSKLRNPREHNIQRLQKLPHLLYLQLKAPNYHLSRRLGATATSSAVSSTSAFARSGKAAGFQLRLRKVFNYRIQTFLKVQNQKLNARYSY